MVQVIEHINVDYARDRYAGHPRQGGIFTFGNGETAVIYNRAPCRYQEQADVEHDYYGYHETGYSQGSSSSRGDNDYYGTGFSQGSSNNSGNNPPPPPVPRHDRADAKRHRSF